jgi:hypothetical protein
MICPIGTYPSPYQTCHHRFQQWVRTGIFEQVLHALATDLQERGGADLSECYLDGTFIVAKKRGGGTKLERLSRGAKVKKLMAISDSTDSLPISVYILSTASPHHEVSFAEATVPTKCFVTNEKPEHLVGDNASDSDSLDERLAVKYGVEMISPHRGWRKRPKKTQDGRPLHRYKHRWKIERVLFAWLQNLHHILYGMNIIQRISWVSLSLDA